MRLGPDVAQYLLLAADGTESIDSIEHFSNGLTGRYYHVSYVVQEVKGKYDIAMAVHNVKWNFGGESEGIKI